MKLNWIQNFFPKVFLFFFFFLNFKMKYKNLSEEEVDLIDESFVFC